MSWLTYQLENKAKIHKCDLYAHILEIPVRKQDSIYVDVGCFTGIDARRIASDGWPEDQIIGMEGNPKWVELGWQLFKDRETSRIHFVTLDIMETITSFESALLQIAPDKAKTIRVVSAFAFFHLFTELKQIQLAKGLWNMLEKQPGNVIVGIQKGMDVPTLRNIREEKQGQDVFFCHSPTSWKSMWLEHVDGELEVKAHFERTSGEYGPGTLHMYWSVRIT